MEQAQVTIPFFRTPKFVHIANDIHVQMHMYMHLHIHIVCDVHDIPLASLMSPRRYVFR